MGWGQQRLPMHTSVMARGFLLGLAACAAVALLAWPAGAASRRITAIVLSIGDGDTIRVRQAGRAITVRLACIDAPEAAQAPYGPQARRYLQQQLPLNREISLDVKTIDRYGRTVAEVFTVAQRFRQVNINLAMVEDGQAYAYRRYLSSCKEQDYLQAERRASQRRSGVWQVAGGITRPWDFRRGR